MLIIPVGKIFSRLISKRCVQFNNFKITVKTVPMFPYHNWCLWHTHLIDTSLFLLPTNRIAMNKPRRKPKELLCFFRVIQLHCPLLEKRGRTRMVWCPFWIRNCPKCGCVSCLLGNGYERISLGARCLQNHASWFMENSGSLGYKREIK